MKKVEILFDQFSRYQALSDIVEKCGEASRTMLDIGSGPECLLGFFIKNKKIFYLDPLVQNNPIENKFQGNIFSTPLISGKKYDCVTAIDVYEHIKPSLRFKFLDEVCKYANNLIIIAFPDSDDQIAKNLDKNLNDNYFQVTGSNYIWLQEHMEYGLPSATETIGYLNMKGWHCQSVGHGYSPWLEALLSLAIYGWDFKDLKPLLTEMSIIFNNKYYLYDYNPPHYRKFIICSRVDDYPKFEKPNIIIDKAVSEEFNNYLRDIQHRYIKKVTSILLRPDGYIFENNRLEKLIKLKDLEIVKFSSELERIYQSRSWKITSVLRYIQSIKNKLIK